MPHWNWFAFNAQSVSMAMLQPVQDAVRKRDLVSWQKIYDHLSQTHTCPYVSRYYGTPIRYTPNKYTILTPGDKDLSRDEIPEETIFPLRHALQMFVEHVSQLRIEGSFPRPRHWISDEVQWDNILESEGDRQELEHFKTHIIARRERVPDPFWCLESNNAVDSNYVAPEAVAEMATMEHRIGLFRGLSERSDLDEDVRGLVLDMKAASLFMQLAASQGLAIFFREDGT
jgi:hypothetical protein